MYDKSLHYLTFPFVLSWLVQMKTLQLYLLVRQQFFLMYGSVKSLFSIVYKRIYVPLHRFLSFFPPDSARDGSFGGFMYSTKNISH